MLEVIVSTKHPNVSLRMLRLITASQVRNPTKWYLLQWTTVCLRCISFYEVFALSRIPHGSGFV